MIPNQPTPLKFDHFERAALVVGLVLAVLLGFTTQKFMRRSQPFGINPDYSPYELVLDPRVSVPPRAYEGHIGPAFGLVNYHGGPFSSLIKAGTPGITGYEVMRDRPGATPWQHNLDSEFIWSKHNAMIMDGADLDGDGREEIIYYCRNPEGTNQEIAAYDPETDTVKGRVALPSGPDRRADGEWDGSYYPFGTFHHTREDGTTTMALVASCRVRYDAIGRGMLALDLEREEILWFFPTAGSPLPDSQFVQDLDGDGRVEIVFGTNGPSNLGDRRINGMSDSQVMVIVLDEGGGLRWARVLAPRSCLGVVQVGDVDDDGRMEVVTGAASIQRVHSEVIVWDGGTGAMEMWRKLPTNLTSMRLIHDAGGKTGTLVFSTLANGLSLYRFQDGDLVPVRSVLDGGRGQLYKTGDYLDHPGEEVVATVMGQGLYLLGADFSLLGFYADETLRGAGHTAFWEPKADQKVLLSGREGMECLLIQPRSAMGQMDYRPALASLGALALVSGSLLVRRRNRNFYRQSLDASDPDILREMRLRLLSDLELSGHGAMGILKSLRRLIWNLETRSSGIGASPEMTRRLGSHWEDFSGGVLPHVRDILGMAEKVDVAPHVVVSVRENLEDLEGVLAQLAATGFDNATILEEIATLQRFATDAEAGMQKIRRSVEDLFRADWFETWERVLRARDDNLQAAGVRVEKDGPEGGVFCRLDPRQLEFMLDNLVGNAVRAMAESADPLLRITTRVEDGMVIGEVRDTGWGIAPEDWDRIMETPYSSRDGGGLGLFETQRILRLFGGGISVKDSRPGEGTTLRLVVPESRAR